ncbi:EF-hand [Coniophora puteana RWD-64-598 SS2]|uniref:EF-hand n=1 Tax=Coniophora puteana (strain RWD-64-598) TaxID=741705 RepID=A0A5M3N3D6_CONPW|nr:EF-hand [Coniophora puteana RWD-64-598 SS2]EIW85411.1 EF-hand [Coniophora puteana RWD-64-598 SS2]
MSYYAQNPGYGAGRQQSAGYTAQHSQHQSQHQAHHQGSYGGSRDRRGGADPYSHGTGGPPGYDPQLWTWFTSVDTDRSGNISVNELQTALVNGNWTHFDLDTIKMLMGTFDTDRTGTINFYEFAGLWKYIADWQNVFKHFDRDASGTIESRELAEAFRSFGYDLSPQMINLIERKYSAAAPSAYGPPPGITFDRFVRACVTVKQLTEAFQKHDRDRNGWATLNYQDFMTIVLEAP